MREHLILIDGSAFIYRAYHALPPLTRKSDGMPISAVAGFCNMLYRLIEDADNKIDVTHLAVVFDAPGKNFRHKLYPKYKANRPKPPHELSSQFTLVRDATRAFGVACVEKKGFEADDLIATYVRIAREASARVTVVSPDKDLMQLVADDVEMLDTMSMKVISMSDVVAKFGVGPARVVDVQSLAGDSVDNVPGVPGIGLKTAGQLIADFGSVEVLYERLDEVRQPKRRASLAAFADQVMLSRKLVQLKSDVAVGALDTLRRVPIDVPALSVFCKEMELHALRQLIADDMMSALGRSGQKPSDLIEAFVWWQDALAGLRPPVHSDPRCGFFKRRLVRGGPWIPCAIWIEQCVDPASGLLSADERLLCAVGGQEADPLKEWTYIVGNPITEAEYRYLIAEAEWSKAYKPSNPSAQPRKKIDPLSVDPVFN